MRKVLILVLLIAVFGAGAVVPVAAQRRGSAAQPALNSTTAEIGSFHHLTVGEKLSYIVKLNDVSAARLMLEVAAKGTFHDQEGYQVTTKVETIGLIRKTMIEVNDLFTTYLDPKTRLPYRAERDIQEGQRTENGVVVFDHSKLKAEIDGKTTVTLKKPTFDLPGLMWAIRNLNFKGGKTQKLNGLDTRAGKLFLVEVEQLGTEKLTIGGEELEAVHLAVRPQDKAGKPSDTMQIRMWISNDHKRLPLLMKATPPFGEIRAELAALPGASTKPEKKKAAETN